MHECYFCGQACDCDGEDTWELEAARNQALEEKEES